MLGCLAVELDEVLSRQDHDPWPAVAAMPDGRHGACGSLGLRLVDRLPQAQRLGALGLDMNAAEVSYNIGRIRSAAELLPTARRYSL